MKKFLALATFVVAVLTANLTFAQGASCGCPDLGSRTEVIITDTGSGTGTTTWTCDNVYKLDGYVFVNSGQTLTIEPGTVIKGLPGSGSDASALIVARGGQINAAGTADCPIIMTFDADPLDGSVAYNTRGQWGGLIVLGAASTNLATNEGQVEGIPSDNDRAKYGGNNDADNSGTIQYVSVRHGGTQLAAANEINGITLAGVGNGTTIDHIEVISNLDDGVEFFGGTVDVRYAAVGFCGDDSFDYDQGYRGRGQYWFVLQDQPGNIGDRGGEYDGDDAAEGGNVTANFQPYATPVIYNYTSFGSGTANNKIGIIYRNGAGGDTHNAIIANYSEGIEIEDLDTFDAYDNWVAGRLNLSNICMVNVPSVIDYDGTAVATGDADLDAYAATNDVATGTPGVDYTYTVNVAGTSFTTTFDPIPTNDVTVGAGGLATDAWFDAADYKGAFDPAGSNWLAGWSWFSEYSAVELIEGCTDATACNYDANAEVDNGSCTYPAAGFDCEGNEIQVGETCDCPPLASRTEVIITDAGSGTGTTTWTCDNVYKLDGYVFVNSGQTLTIEPGTVIKGLPGSGSDASALIVARGGQINASGTDQCPITFTFDADPLDGSVAYNTRGQWGGVIILGAASTNLATNEGQVEGIPSDNDRAKYGGNNDADNSGTLQYVSIRHGGTQLAAANEINGLTLAGVGNGTTIDHIEVISNLDDGVEFFGGTVDLKYAAVAFCGDDSFDYDQGYRGRGQYWFVLQDQPGNVGDRGGEYDGDDAAEGGNVTANFQPYATPVIYNYTSFGSGTANNKIGIIYRNGAGGDTHNAIIANYSEGIEIEDLDTFDAYDNWVAGRLNLSNICMVNVPSVIDYDGSAVATGDADLDAYAATNNVATGTPGVDYTYAVNVAGTSFTDTFDPVPTNDVTVGAGGLATDAWFDAADYKGAFDPNGVNWLGGQWSYLGTSSAIAGTPGCTDETACNYNAAATIDDGSCLFAAAGYDCEGNVIGGGGCGCPPLASRTEVIITDAGSGTGTTTWTCDNVYKLDGYVFVNSGQTLTVEPGTVIKGLPGSGADASALIVARGGQINAAGTADCPIIMTFDADPLDGSVSYDTRGQWGGFLVLGAASTNLATNEGQVEGIPSDNDRAKYGGNNDADNSGVIQYVSIRHGGTQLAAANEINGLTLAGVGNGTTIDHIEVISNLDDGVEFFGGTVDVKYAAVGFCGDDSFDYDQGYRGRGQYWFVVQDQPGNVGDRGGEYDGDDAAEGGNVTANFQPYATPVIYNYTSFGSGTANNKIGIIYRNGAGGDTHNGIIANFSEGIEIEDLDTFDAYDNWVAGRLNLSNICMVNVPSVIDYDGTAVATGDADLDAYAAANNVATGTPGIDYTYNFDGTGTTVTDILGVNPTNDVTVGAGGLPTDAWFDAADYKGAFDPAGGNWMSGWSWMDEVGLFGVTTVSGCTNPAACNYDASATTDDGSCILPGDSCDDGDANTINDTVQADCSCAGDIPGCTDPAACNYDATATVDDASCEYLSCAGCTNAAACNYDAAATIDDGSCVLPGDSCDDGDVNTINDTVQADCSCAGDLQGCTDADATNYNVNATSDDGSCQYTVQFFVDMAVEGGNAAFIIGDVTGGSAASMTYIGYDVYMFSVNLGVGSFNYNFQNESNVNESLTRSLTVVDAPITLAVVCFDELVACAGCTNPMFAEFNPYAGSDDGSCATMVVAGCTYADADNYMASATYDDGSCTFTVGGSCPEDLNGDGVVNAGDLLQFLGAFGQSCN